MTILVTGGAGFIGSSLVDRLLSVGHAVLAIDNYDDFYDRSIKEKNIQNALYSASFKLIEGDIRNENLLSELFRNYRIDLVTHLAAKAGVRPSIKNPEIYFDVNVRGTLNILEAMRKNNVRKLIFTSSSSVYGNNKKVPFSESDIVDNPISPYAASKKAGELLCHTYHHLHGFDIFCLRLFTVYGPRQRPDLAIHKFAKLIMEGKPIPFFGDGSTERDYTYIEDIVDGIMRAIKNLKGYDIFNLGESKTISLIELVHTLEKLLGKKAIIDYLPTQPGDVTKTYADISKTKQLLGYNPSTIIEEGIEKFINWLTK